MLVKLHVNIFEILFTGSVTGQAVLKCATPSQNHQTVASVLMSRNLLLLDIAAA